MAKIVIYHDGPIVTARKAFEAGDSRYFTGKPCLKGHIAQRMLSNGVCAECLKEKRARARIRYASDPERKAKNYANVKEWRKTHSRAEEASKYRKKRPDIRAKIAAKYRENNIDEIRRRDREHAARMRKTNPEAEKRRQKEFRQRREQRLSDLAGVLGHLVVIFVVET